MPMKKTLTVADLRGVNSDPKHAFKVVKVTNDISFKIGEYVSEHDLKTLFEVGSQMSWTVNIVPWKR